MATTKVETTIKKGFDTVKNTTDKLNNTAVSLADNLVDETLATGKEWQDIMEKALKTGTMLFGKQQDLVFDTLEAVKTQYFTGTKRFGKLFSFNIANNKKVEKAAKTVKKEVAKTTKKVETKTKIATAKAKAKVTAIEKKATAARKEAPKNNLKVIEGVGPKLETILNEAGIFTFKKLAKSKTETLKEILLSAGSRYKMHDPTTWAAQAELADAGKMVELKAFQDELKGGKLKK